MTWQHISIPLIKVIEKAAKAYGELDEKPKPKRKPTASRTE